MYMTSAVHALSTSQQMLSWFFLFLMFLVSMAMMTVFYIAIARAMMAM